MNELYEIKNTLCYVCQQDVYNKVFEQTRQAIPGVFSKEMIPIIKNRNDSRFVEFLNRQQEIKKAHYKMCVVMGYDEEVSVCKECLRYLVSAMA